jgi:biopolymer transport protein ExbD
MAAIVKREIEPISEINITPMIDVMLVLIVMMILTIPIMSHKVPIDLPAPGVASDQTAPHRLEITRGGTLNWDGRAIADIELAPLLAGMIGNEAAPVLHMRTDPEARYERFDQVLAQVKRANVQRLGFVGDAALIGRMDP